MSIHCSGVIGRGNKKKKRGVDGGGVGSGTGASQSPSNHSYSLLHRVFTTVNSYGNPVRREFNPARVHHSFGDVSEDSWSM